jgi:pyridoxal phosphate enzyme (YggS family)
MTDRDAEVAAGLAAVQERIASAATAAGRAPGSVTLVVVTKNWPASDVRRLAGLGVRDVGENRDQEASAKATECADLDLRWHFIGQLQTNKARSVAAYADCVHSVDRGRLVRALSQAAQDAGRTLGALVQVNLDGEAGRGGALPAEVPALADAVAEAPALELRGVMAVAPLAAAGPDGRGDPVAQERVAEAAFERLATLAAALRTAHPEATWVSAGMSEDLEAAIAAGATHVRVGSAILGARPHLR